MFRGKHLRKLRDGKIILPPAIKLALQGQKIFLITRKNARHIVLVFEDQELPTYVEHNPKPYTSLQLTTVGKKDHTLKIPKGILGVSGLKDCQLILVGILDSLEIWDKEIYDKEMDDDIIF